MIAQWAYPSSIVPLSFELHSHLAKEHDGARHWGYRRISCGRLTANDLKLPASGSPFSWSGLSSWIPLGKRKYLTGKTDVSADDLPGDLDWLNPNGIKSYEAISTTDDTAQVNPLQFTASMAMLAEEAGARIILGSVDAIGYGAANDNPLEGKSFEEEKIGMLPDLHVSHGNGVQSITYTDKATSESRSIPADIVVLAAGPWTPVLFPAAPISSLRAHSITIRPTRLVSAYCLFTHIPVPLDDADDDYTNSPDTAVLPGAAKVMSPEIYSRPNNEVYVCGSGDNTVPLPANTDAVEVSRQDCQNIANAVASISDELKDGIVTSRRACYLPTVDIGGSGGPLVGETGIPGLLLAAGHSCWGIHNAPATGKLISEMIFDGEATSADIKGLDPRLVI